jgi:hypothetical protein
MPLKISNNNKVSLNQKIMERKRRDKRGGKGRSEGKQCRKL